jgi:hypothetical protein
VDEDEVKRKKGPSQPPGTKEPDEPAREPERTRKKGPSQPVGDDNPFLSDDQRGAVGEEWDGTT